MNENELDALTTRVGVLLAMDGWYRVRQALAELGEPAVPILINKIQEGKLDRKFTERAVLALGEIGGNEAERFLVTLLEHSDPVMRAAALAALKQIGSTSNGAVIAQLLNDKDDAVRKEAIRTLALLGDETSLQGLKVLEQSEEKEFLKEEARRAIEDLERRLAQG